MPLGFQDSVNRMCNALLEEVQVVEFSCDLKKPLNRLLRIRAKERDLVFYDCADNHGFELDEENIE